VRRSPRGQDSLKERSGDRLLHAVALQIGYKTLPSYAGKWLKNKVTVGFLNRSERGTLR
jgi:hypothetical protein